MSDMSGHPVFDPANGAWFYYEAWIASLARIAALEAELAARPRGIGDSDIQALFDRAEKAEAGLAKTVEAHNDLFNQWEQASGALSSAERALIAQRKEISQLKKAHAYYKEHYELVFEQRNEAEAKVAALLKLRDAEQTGGATHWKDCYLVHHACAVSRIAELEAERRQS